MAAYNNYRPYKQEQEIFSSDDFILTVLIIYAERSLVIVRHKENYVLRIVIKTHIYKIFFLRYGRRACYI
jgi:hypothetical protein